MPPQNMPLWHKAYFELKASEKKEIRKALCPFSICLKEGHTFIKLSPLPCLPGRTEVNHPGQL